jgi:hypothetical protein
MQNLIRFLSLSVSLTWVLGVSSPVVDVPITISPTEQVISASTNSSAWSAAESGWASNSGFPTQGTWTAAFSRQPLSCAGACASNTPRIEQWRGCTAPQGSNVYENGPAAAGCTTQVGGAGAY